MIILQIAAFLIFLLSVVTLFQPKTGMGRLVCFIPKLFTGTMIGWIGFLGFCSAILGIIFEDPWLIGLGFVTVAIAFRNIHRIVQRSLKVGRRITTANPLQADESRKMMLPYPWIVHWAEGSEETDWKKDVEVAINNETGEPVLADLWQPSDPEYRSGLGLIYLHGSGWHYADKDFGTRHFFRHLTSQGHVIADLAYTLAPKADLFGMTADIKRAIDWMKQNAQSLGFRSDRIILMGGSAGGHLALLTAFTPNHPQFDPPGLTHDTSIHGVVSYYGPPDLNAQFDRFTELPGLTGSTKFERMLMKYLEARFGFESFPVHSLLPEFLGGTPEEVPELYEIGSPINHVGQDCPPTLLLQGLHDFSGAAPEVSRLHDSLKRVGAFVYLLEIPDTEHGFDLFRPQWSPAAQAATYVTDRFLASLI